MIPSGTTTASRPSPPPPASPLEHAPVRHERDLPTDGGVRAPGGLPPGKPARANRSRAQYAPLVARAYSPGGLRSRLTCARRADAGRRRGSGGGVGGRLFTPPRTMLVRGGRAKRVQNRAPGRKYHQDGPSTHPLPPPRRPGVLSGLALVVQDVVANAVLLAPIPPVLVTGGAGGTRAEGLSRFRGARRCEHMRHRAPSPPPRSTRARTAPLVNQRSHGA